MGTILYLGYQVDAENGIVMGIRHRPLIKTENGYVVVWRTKPRFRMAAHRMIWESVHGSIPAGLQVNHINGIKHDNRIANLELVTGSENTRHAYRLGLRRAGGEKNGRAKLSVAQVLEIRKSGESSRALARRYGVSPSTIRDVISRRKWRDVA